MRWMNRFATATILLAVVAGPPAAAAVWWSHTSPRWPTRGQVHAWLEQPVTAGTILAGCIAVAALGWLLLLYHLARRTTRHIGIRWRRRRHRPLPTPAQVTASSMAGVAALTLPGMIVQDQPPTQPTATDASPPAGPQAPDTLPDDQPSPGAVGIDLPGGGWVPRSTALAVTATAALIWLRRRQQYQPAPPGRQRRHRDHDLQPLPDTVHAITATMPSDAGTPELIDTVPAGTIQLIGPGAAAAARGMIVNNVLAAAGHGPHRRLLLCRRDLAVLLPGADPDELTTAGIHIHDDPHDSPPQTEKPAAELPAARGDQLAEQAAAPATIRLHPDPPSALVWQVTRDGVTTGTGLTEPRRLCVLDEQATTDLLTLARTATQQQAHSLSRPQPATNPAPPPAASPTATATVPPARGHLAMIGRCELSISGTPVPIRRSAGLQILAYLATHPDGATKIELIHACWPGHSPAAITQRLHTTVSELRQQLQPLLGANPVSHHDGHYHLNPRAVTTDLHTWRRTIHTAGHAATADERLRASHTAIGLYTGELAAGRHWSWLAPARETLRRDAIDAHLHAADHAAPDQAAHLRREALAIDPHNQHLRGRFVRFP